MRRRQRVDELYYHKIKFLKISNLFAYSIELFYSYQCAAGFDKQGPLDVLKGSWYIPNQEIMNDSTFSTIYHPAVSAI